MEKVQIVTEFIKLEQLMKLAGMVGSGAEAKIMIGEGKVLVNGNVESRRGKKLRPGDKVEFEEKNYLIE